MWRLLDSGLTAPARNIALSRAVLEARQAEEIPSTLHFSRVTRCAMLASHQSAQQELDLEFCRAHAITVQRRITGGAAMYSDEGQLAWELYLDRRECAAPDLRSLAKRICHAAATALSASGIDARYRAPCEIEVDGRTLASGGFASEGDAILFQCILRIDCDPARAFAALRTPWAGAPAALNGEARKRVTSLKDELGHPPDLLVIKHNLVEAFESEFEVEFREADLGLSEKARFEAASAQIDSPAWVGHISRAASETPLVEVTHRAAPQLLRAVVAYEAETLSFRHVWFAGEALMTPGRILGDLEAALRGVQKERLAQRIEWFFASHPFDLRGLAPADFTALLLQATGRRLVSP